jgi:predicted transcriptional regulator
MVKNVLMSIKPKYVNKIFNGEKRYEYRRVMFKHDIGKVFIYATAPVSMLVGEFTSGAINYTDPEFIWSMTGRHSGISRDDFLEYFFECERGVCVAIYKPVRWEYPRSLMRYGIKRPPQSFMYLDDNQF